jgi:hypothetical protein
MIFSEKLTSFEQPIRISKIIVKVIGHYGDEALKAEDV